jgi:hypothetical protein
MLTRSDLSPISSVAIHPPRIEPLSEMKPYAIAFTARALAGQPPRPITLTVWALGVTMALILARRQAEIIGLIDVSPMRWSIIT